MYWSGSSSPGLSHFKLLKTIPVGAKGRGLVQYFSGPMIIKLSSSTHLGPLSVFSRLKWSPVRMEPRSDTWLPLSTNWR